MVNRILVIDDACELSDEISDLFKEDCEMEVSFSKSNKDDLRRNMRYDYYMIIIDYNSLENDFDKLIDYISSYLNNLPLIFLVADEKEVYYELRSHKICFIKRPINQKVLHKQLKNNVSLLESYRNVNDLSHFPSNSSIQEVLKEKIKNKSEFAIMYFDINYFKEYNDYYGIYQANLLIKFLAQIIYDTVVEYGSFNDFIGHSSGDNFTIILNSYENVAKMGEKIIQKFESSLPEFYTKKDYDNGYITVLNRNGDMQKIGFISLLIVVISNEFNDYKSADEVSKKKDLLMTKAVQMGRSVFLQDNQD